MSNEPLHQPSQSPAVASEAKPQPSASEPRHVYTPALDIYETDAGLVLEADLPGVRPEDLQIRVQDNVLHLYGKVSWPLPVEARLLHEELRPEDFYRSFILSDEVDTEHITADFTDGVLQ